MSIRPTFGIRIPECASATEVAACVKRAEEMDFDVAWLPDSQFLWRDVWSTLAVAATVTDRIHLGTCVTNFETRHVSVTAAAAGTLDELAPDRVVLGVATGDSSIKTLGLRPTKVATMRERILQLRALLAGESVDFAGRQMSMKAIPRRRVPIYIAAGGTKAMALAGEICDGAIVFGLSPDLVRSSLERIAAGAAGAARPAGAVNAIFGTFCHVASDEREAARIVKPQIVALAQVGAGEALRSVGIDIHPPQIVGGIYPDMGHAEDWDAAAEIAGEWVTDEMALRYADRFCMVGSAEACIKRLAAAIDAGARHFYVRHFSSYSLPDELLSAFGRLVIPHFRD